MTGRQTLPDAKGSSIVPVATVRNLKVIPILEAEMTSLGFMNFFGSLCYSISAGFLSYGFALYLQKQVTPEGTATDTGETMLSFGPSACFIGCLLFFVLGCVLAIVRWYSINNIKKQAVTRSADMGG